MTKVPLHLLRIGQLILGRDGRFRRLIAILPTQSSAVMGLEPLPGDEKDPRRSMPPDDGTFVIAELLKEDDK